MHQSIFHKLCLRIALWAVVVFSLAGYHHHEATHICLGWEHLMLHNHCQKGINCLPTDTSAQDTPCHCHSGKILGLEKKQQTIHTTAGCSSGKIHLLYSERISVLYSGVSQQSLSFRKQSPWTLSGVFLITWPQGPSRFCILSLSVLSDGCPQHGRQQSLRMPLPSMRKRYL